MMMLMHIPFYLSKCALLCWHEFQAPDECSHVIAVCTHGLLMLTGDGRQDESTHQHTRGFFFCEQAKTLLFVWFFLMGLVAIHPQEFTFFEVFLLLQYVLDI